MTDRWTAETEELATSAFEDWALSRIEPDDLWDKPAGAARAVLTALTDAGLLLPPGGETRQEWGRPRPGPRVAPCAPTERDRCATQPEEHARRPVTVWPDPERPEADWPRYVGPWVPVDDDGET